MSQVVNAWVDCNALYFLCAFVLITFKTQCNVVNLCKKNLSSNYLEIKLFRVRLILIMIRFISRLPQHPASGDAAQRAVASAVGLLPGDNFTNPSLWRLFQKARPF